MLHSAFFVVVATGTLFQAEMEFQTPDFVTPPPPPSWDLTESDAPLLVPPVTHEPDPGKPERLGPQTKQVPADIVPTALERQIFQLINEARANPAAFGYGSLPSVPPLHWNAALLHIGRVHSQDMNDDNYFEHDSYDRVGGNLVKVADWFARVQTVYPFNVRISENILRNSSGSASDAAHGWMDSPPHRGNIMDSRLTEGSIGVYQGSRGTYWTHDFGGRNISLNLAIADLSFQPAAPQPGNSVQVRFNLHNTGQTDAYPVEVILYRGNPAAGGVPITGLLSLPPILVGGSTRFTNVPPIDTAGFPQASEVYVVLDPNNRFNETSEADNLLHGPLFGSVPATPSPTPLLAASNTPTPTFSPPTPTPTTSVACAERVHDGGFESGPPYSDWDQVFQRFEVLYTSYSGGPPPYEGSHFCWFGGISDGIEESASIQQSLILPMGFGTLSYFIRISQGLAADSMRVLLDGVEIARYAGTDASAYSAYSRRTHNVSAYCDGGAHVLRFESTVTGRASFYLDNLSLVVCPESDGLGPCAEALFEFCHHWKSPSHGAGELLGILRSLP